MPNYESLALEIINSSVTTLACLPKTGHRLAEALANKPHKIDVFEADNLKSAMDALAEKQQQFDTLILSPAAPSYNQFRDYIERGEAFVALGKELLL